jgi:uncharacterized protein (TIGR02246 family)
MTDGDRHRIEALLVAVSEAWNAGDADAYGALFTEDASYVPVTGALARGRRQITDAHRELFARRPGSRMTRGTKADREIRFLTPDTAVVVGTGPGTTGADSTVCFVAVRLGTEWRFAHFQNTPVAQPGQS